MHESARVLVADDEPHTRLATPAVAKAGCQVVAAVALPTPSTVAGPVARVRGLTGAVPG